MVELSPEEKKKRRRFPGGKKTAFAGATIGAVIIFTAFFTAVFTGGEEEIAEEVPPVPLPAPSPPPASSESSVPSSPPVSSEAEDSSEAEKEQVGFSVPALKEEEIKENPFVSEYIRKIIKQAVKEVVEEEKTRIRQEMMRLSISNLMKKEKSEKKKEEKEGKEIKVSEKDDVRIPDVLKVKSVYTVGENRYVETDLYGLIGKGSRINGWEVVEVKENSIVLSGKGRKKVMRLLFEFKKPEVSGGEEYAGGEQGAELPPLPPFPIE